MNTNHSGHNTAGICLTQVNHKAMYVYVYTFAMCVPHQDKTEHKECRPATLYRLPVSGMDFGIYLTDTAVLHFNMDFSQIYGKIIFNQIMPTYASQTYTV